MCTRLCFMYTYMYACMCVHTKRGWPCTCPRCPAGRAWSAHRTRCHAHPAHMQRTPHTHHTTTCTRAHAQASHPHRGTVGWHTDVSLARLLCTYTQSAPPPTGCHAPALALHMAPTPHPHTRTRPTRHHPHTRTAPHPHTRVAPHHTTPHDDDDDNDDNDVRSA